MGKILDLTKHDKFKQLMVPENNDPKATRQVVKIKWLKSDSPEMKFANVDLKEPLFFAVSDDMVEDIPNVFENVKYDIYIATNNKDHYNNIRQYIYDRTEKW